MRDSLQIICNDFIANRDTVKKVFKRKTAYIYPICANIFCGRKVLADEKKLEECKHLVKKKAGAFSNFRGNMAAPVTAMLAAGKKPEEKFDKALKNYDKLKKIFKGSEYLSLIAFLLVDMVNDEELEEKMMRGKAIYDKMKKEHPFLTSREDTVFAILMAFLDKTDDEIITEMESCYKILCSQFSSKDSVQSLAQTLVFSEMSPKEKADRVISIYDGIKKAGGKYGKYYELATLGAVAMTDTDTSQIIEDMMEVDKFLSVQKGYGGFGIDKKTRMMHAAMIVSNDYKSHQNVEAASITRTIAMIAAQQAAMCAIIASTTAAQATVSSN